MAVVAHITTFNAQATSAQAFQSLLASSQAPQSIPGQHPRDAYLQRINADPVGTASELFGVDISKYLQPPALLLPEPDWTSSLTHTYDPSTMAIEFEEYLNDPNNWDGEGGNISQPVSLDNFFNSSAGDGQGSFLIPAVDDDAPIDFGGNIHTEI